MFARIFKVLCEYKLQEYEWWVIGAGDSLLKEMEAPICQPGMFSYKVLWLLCIWDL